MVQHCCFLARPARNVGDAGRNTIIGPGTSNFDFSAFKNTRLTERFTLEFRSEFFNIFNKAQFNLPVFDPTNQAFGQITSVRAARQIQFGMKLLLLNMIIDRRTFLTLAGSTLAARAQPSKKLDVLLNEEIGKISPLIYGQMAEHVGRLIYDGIWVGPSSRIRHHQGLVGHAGGFETGPSWHCEVARRMFRRCIPLGRRGGPTSQPHPETESVVGSRGTKFVRHR